MGGDDEDRPDRGGVVFDSVETPILGKIWQLWEAKRGCLDLTDSRVISIVEATLRRRIFVSCIFLDGRAILYTYPGAKLGKKVREHALAQGIEVIPLDKLLKDSRKDFLFRQNKDRPG